ncbi:MAG: hypothetical protein HQ556_01355 [Candidatus Marinimicrobia bacterium]|nr:hypothetical protein [Candidatus Neomarinimicrobiota bacterium]
MFKRISKSWQLVKASAAVLKADRELIVFPIISLICVFIVTATFAIPTFLTGIVDNIGVDQQIPILGYVFGFSFYLTLNFVIFFFNSALVGAAMIRLRGGDPTVRDGFLIATRHIDTIFGYALISATVGIVLRGLSERAGFLGQIVISMIGLVWSLATYLVVPVLVIEGVGPVQGVKRSAQLLKETWGEQIVGNFGIGVIFGLLTFGVILLSVPIIMAVISTGSQALIILTVLLLILTVATIGVLSTALSGIYAAAVYRYAVEGETGGFFSQELVQNAFRPK